MGKQCAENVYDMNDCPEFPYLCDIPTYLRTNRRQMEQPTDQQTDMRVRRKVLLMYNNAQGLCRICEKKFAWNVQRFCGEIHGCTQRSVQGMYKERAKNVHEINYRARMCRICAKSVHGMCNGAKGPFKNL